MGAKELRVDMLSTMNQFSLSLSDEALANAFVGLNTKKDNELWRMLLRLSRERRVELLRPSLVGSSLNFHILRNGPVEKNKNKKKEKQCYSVEFVVFVFGEALRKHRVEECEQLVLAVKRSGLLLYALKGMTAAKVGIRNKCYRMVEVFHTLLGELKGRKVLVSRKWWFMMESLRLSIGVKHQRLSGKVVHFVSQAMQCSQKLGDRHCGILCDAFAQDVFVRHQRIPLMHRLLLPHFVDIEQHHVDAIDCEMYVAEHEEHSDISNRRVSWFYSHADDDVNIINEPLPHNDRH